MVWSVCDLQEWGGVAQGGRELEGSDVVRFAAGWAG